MKHQTLLSAEQIQKRIIELAKTISHDYAKKDLVVLGILKGSFILMADLVRALDIPNTCEFLRVKSYENNQSSGAIQIESGTNLNLKGKHVLLVEDIVDTALTFTTLLEYLESKEVASLNSCVLLLKEQAIAYKNKIRYLGFTIPNDYVYGYGMDDEEKFRHLPFVAKKS